MGKELFLGDLAESHADSFILNNSIYQLDMLVVRPDEKGSCGKQSAQEVNDFLSHSTVARQKKAVVIYDFDNGNPAFYDCLLKTVEDADCDLVFTARSTANIPDTMLNRLTIRNTVRLSIDAMSEKAKECDLPFDEGLYAMSGGSWSLYTAVLNADKAVLETCINGIKQGLSGDIRSLLVALGVIPDGKSLFDTHRELLPFILNYCDYAVEQAVRQNPEFKLSIQKCRSLSIDTAVFRRKLKRNAGKNDFLAWARSFAEEGGRVWE